MTTLQTQLDLVQIHLDMRAKPLVIKQNDFGVVQGQPCTLRQYTGRGVHRFAMCQVAGARQTF